MLSPHLVPRCASSTYAYLNAVVDKATICTVLPNDVKDFPAFEEFCLKTANAITLFRTFEPSEQAHVLSLIWDKYKSFIYTAQGLPQPRETERKPCYEAPSNLDDFESSSSSEEPDPDKTYLLSVTEAYFDLENARVVNTVKLIRNIGTTEASVWQEVTAYYRDGNYYIIDEQS